MTKDAGGISSSGAFEGLDDVEDSAEELFWRDRDGEVAALLDAERRGVTLAQRLLGQADEVHIQTAHGGIHGTVIAIVDGFVFVTAGTEARLCAVVSVAAVAGIRGLAPRPRVASADTMTVAARMAATVTRWLSHAIGNRVAVHGCGWSITGDLTAVYADHLEISSAGGCTAVPLHALDVVFVASG